MDEVLGEEFAGVLVSDCYAAYHHYDGPTQRCWAHLLRDVHDLRALYPDDHQLDQWADAVHQLYRQGTDTKMTLASLCGTWRAQGFNPLTACRQLLTSPQL